MFADVSGFTALSEAMSKHGPKGAEYLAKHVREADARYLNRVAHLRPPARSSLSRRAAA